MSPTAENQIESHLESNRSEYCYRQRNVSPTSPTPEKLTKSPPEAHRSSYRYKRGNFSPMNPTPEKQWKDHVEAQLPMFQCRQGDVSPRSPETAAKLLEGRNISLSKSGQIVASHDCRSMDYFEFMSERMKQMRIDVNETKKIQLAVAKVPQSSDAVVRLLNDIISQQADVIVGISSMACSPVNEVQRFSCQLTGRCAKDPQLEDMPEAVVDTLIGCCLDGLLLGTPELEMTKDELIENPTKTDIRKYQIRGGNLVPRLKTKIAREEDEEARVANTMEGDDVRN